MTRPSAHPSTQRARSHASTVPAAQPATQPATQPHGSQVAQLRGRPPILPRSYVPRERLGRALRSATDGGGITVLVAPAGAGKTLGVAGWLREHDGLDQVVWVPRADALTVDDLELLTGPAADQGGPRRLVIDDAHELSPAVVTWLDGRLDQAPEELDVLLLSRWDLPFTRLVHELLGNLTVLRGGLLRLDEHETAQLVADHARNDSPDLARVISARTRGWSAAVVLAAKALGDRPDPVAAARQLATNVGILDRVASEAFAALTPRQRHVLLCVAAEPVVRAPTAIRLSNDPAAGRILEELESTGLHVTRYDDPLVWLRPRDDAGYLLAATESAQDAEPSYVVHPLMRELSRRRLAAGGVDVERARATVRRAVQHDLDRGELADALRRLVTAGDHAAAVHALATHGPAIVLSGHTRDVASFASAHPELVAQAPACWFALAVERWESGDVGRARDWLARMSRAISAKDPEATSIGELDAACVRLLRGCLDDEPLERIADLGEGVLDTLTDDGPDWARVSLLRLLVGTARVRLGDLGRGERHLTRVADADGVAARSPALMVRATSQIALAQLIRGCEHTASRLSAPGHNQQATAGAAGMTIARQLASVHMLPEPQEGGDAPEPPAVTRTAAGAATADHVDGDPVAHVLLQLLRSRRLVLEGRAAEAQRVLETGVSTVSTPVPLRGTICLEEALQAALTGDRDVLRAVAAELTSLGLPGEAALVDGFRADLSDDLAKATELFEVAALTATLRQPPAAALALVSRAQVLDALGRRSEGLESLAEAVTTTEVRRTLVPFLGWSRHGRPIPDLLRDVARERRIPWADELAAATGRRTSLASLAGPMTATPQEQAHVAAGATYVSLSPRERDVLHELARGSTYADIAANLFLSENTVKTHVSSVYAKLAVNRRSDALAVARTLHLI